MKQGRVIVLTGPTASGKSSLGIELAQYIGNGEIINSDSIQVYQGLPILSSAPSMDDLALVRHHLYGYLSSSESCSAGKWMKLVKNKIDEVIAKGNTPIILGGTPMYNRILIDGISQIPEADKTLINELKSEVKTKGHSWLYSQLTLFDPEYAIKIHHRDTTRALRAYSAILTTGQKFSHLLQIKSPSILDGLNVIKICLLPAREIVYNNCIARIEKMFANGVISEVESFLSTALSKTLQSDLPIYSTIGLKEIDDFLEEKITLNEAKELIVTRTKQYAKHQYTWFNNRFNDFIKISSNERLLECINKHCCL